MYPAFTHQGEICVLGTSATRPFPYIREGIHLPRRGRIAARVHTETASLTRRSTQAFAPRDRFGGRTWRCRARCLSCLDLVSMRTHASRTSSFGPARLYPLSRADERLAPCSTRSAQSHGYPDVPVRIMKGPLVSLRPKRRLAPAGLPPFWATLRPLSRHRRVPAAPE